ncbi:MAG: lysophospholipid acyltransferase family protein [Lentisphaeria bacterium]|nr:lysophospholipid acyltransferase family protein [Lentisphaeria bacterium]
MANFLKKIPILPKPVLYLIAGILKLIRMTQRVTYIDPSNQLEQLDQRPGIYLLWHNRLILLPLMFSRSTRKKTRFLASGSRDGGYIFDFLAILGLRGFQGSSSKGGTKAVLRMKQAIKNRESIVITPDGPRGPKYAIHEGAIYMASKLQVPLFPVVYNSKWHITLKTWDRFQLPLPFSEGELIIGEPIYLPENLDREGLKEWSAKVKAEMDKITHFDHN